MGVPKRARALFAADYERPREVRIQSGRQRHGHPKLFPGLYHGRPNLYPERNAGYSTQG